VCVLTHAVNLGLALSFWRLDRALPLPVRWSLLSPSPRALLRGAPADYYRSLVKGGLGALTVTLALTAYVLGVVPFNQVRAQGTERLWGLLDRIRDDRLARELPEVDMAVFDGRPSLGPAQAIVHVAVVGDFQCTFCRMLAQQLELLRRQWPDDVRVTFVHSPLGADCNPHLAETVHEDACWLAEASAAAAEQGRFWELHELFFSKLPLARVRRDVVVGRLAELGVDEGALRECMASGRARSTVRADVELCAQLGLTATPSLVVNGYAWRGTMMPQMLSDLVAFLVHNERPEEKDG
jgi:predicted DsbA family dithiol-disulfide isomerase